MQKDYTAFIEEKTYIDGHWVEAESGRTFDVQNPATGALLASVPDMDKSAAIKAVEAAYKAFPAWRDKTAKERSKTLRRFFDLITENTDNLAALLTAEQGKPLKEARGEVAYGASFIEWYAEEAKRIYGQTIPSHKNDARVIVLRQPVGVVASITPWNFPSAMITRKIAPALAAGCTVVLKPAADTPLSALALARLAEKAGIPKGVFNIVTTNEYTKEVGEVLSTHEKVRKISFTGSTGVGKILMKQASGTVKKIALELGGNAPFIVFKSADLEAAAHGAIACKFRNAGQTCVCANRIYVEDEIYDQFAKIFAQKVAALKVGDGADEGTDIGPLINEAGLKKVKNHVADAIQKGAKLIEGGEMHDQGDLFFQPTVLLDMDEDSLLCCEETFGPVAGLFRFHSEDEVLQKANDTPYGLASYFYSQDYAQIIRVSEALEYGMVGVNEPLLSAEAVPFGGIKESGIGREGGAHGIEDYTNIKYVLLGGL